MKVMTIQVPDDSVEFVEEFVERIGGNVEEKEEEKNASVKKSKGKSDKTKGDQTKKLKKKKEKIYPTFMFGKWKDFDIDARKLREEAWTRKF